VFECTGTGTCIDIDFDQRIIRIPNIGVEAPFSSSVLVNGNNYNGSYQTLPNGQYENEID